MKTLKLLLKESGLSGLKWWQWLLAVWFCISLFGLTMNENAPVGAWIIVSANLSFAGYFFAKYVKLNVKED